jgi:riboflavin kinase/FMN adenylyltransferase
VGSDFHFGRARRGTPDYLRAAGAERGFAVDVLDLLDEGDAAVSSSRVRAALTAGDIAAANALLGYHWFFSGEVAEGDHRGRDLGYPTANLSVSEQFKLAMGVYAVRVRLDGELHDGVASFGKPMFDHKRPPFETHIFDFQGNIYGQQLTVGLIGHIRPQMEFAGMPELIAAMAEDSRLARRVLDNAAPLSELDSRLGFVR